MLVLSFLAHLVAGFGSPGPYFILCQVLGGKTLMNFSIYKSLGETQSSILPATSWMVLSPKSNDEALTTNVTVFGEGTFKKVIKVKWSRKDGALLQQD